MTTALEIRSALFTGLHGIVTLCVVVILACSIAELLDPNTRPEQEHD